MSNVLRKDRSSNIELLRIIAMFMIICFHYVLKSKYDCSVLTYNTFIIKSFYMLGEVGVNLFVLITGYFMIKGKFSWKKLICLLLEVSFYFLISIYIGIKLGIYEYTTFRAIFLLFFPTIMNRYWFTTAYILLYILSPYLNIFIL